MKLAQYCKLSALITGGVITLYSTPLLAQIEQKPTSSPTIKTTEINSVLFFPSEIEAIINARLFYEQHPAGSDKGDEDFLKTLEKSASDIGLGANPEDFTYPQFFLSSIAYYSPDNWVIWVNNEKITQDSAASISGLYVSEINKDKVVFEWQPKRMDKIVDTKDYSPENPVQVNFITNRIKFTLKVNQTFTSYAMQVVEGKVPPVTIKNTPSSQ